MLSLNHIWLYYLCVYVYIKTNHASDNNYNNCICLGDSRIGASTLPRITGFSAEEPVRLIDCELYWKFRGTDKCEECEG